KNGSENLVAFFLCDELFGHGMIENRFPVAEDVAQEVMYGNNTGKSLIMKGEKIADLMLIHYIHAELGRIGNLDPGHIGSHHFFYRGGLARTVFQNHIAAIVTFTKNTFELVAIHHYKITEVNRVQHFQSID